MKEKSVLFEIIIAFLKLGLLGFGGPAAHIALMEEEFVRRRGWLTREKFLDLIAASNLIPGPNSTELAIHLGYLRAGFPGLVLAGLAFIFPAALIVSALGLFYAKYGSLPAAAGMLSYIKPVMIAIILQALWGLGRAALKTPALAGAALACALLSFSGISEVAILFGAASFAVLKHVLLRKKTGPILPSFFALPLAGTAVAATTAFSFSKLFFIFLKIGSLLFGSGYVLLAFLRTEFVEKLGWLTESQLLDAIAVGQVTPGPVFTTATFIGTLLAGPKGGFIATAGIFLPAFLFVAITAPFIARLRESALLSSVLDYVNAASLALMAGVTFFLSQNAVTSPITAALMAVSLFLIVRFRVSSVWLILAAGLTGIILRVQA